MTRKKSSKLTLMTSVLLAMLLAIGLALPAFATTFPIPPESAGEAVETSKAAITKWLEVPVNTAYPAMDFEFVISQVAEDEKAPTADMPVIGKPHGSIPKAGVITISYDGALATNPAETLDYENIIGINFYRLESEDIFAGVEWPHAGIYEYKIVEAENTYTLQVPPPPIKEFVKYSKAEYSVYVYVQRDPDTGKLEITHIGVLMIKDDDDKPVVNPTKKDPTPGGGADFNHSQMIFRNGYVKINGPVPPGGPDDTTFAIGKEVKGTYSDPNIYFSFRLVIEAPIIAPKPASFKAYVVEEDPDDPGKYIVVTTADNYAGFNPDDKSITVTSGSPLLFKLKHGQYLVFSDVHVGAYFSISETGATGYTTSVVVTIDGKPGYKDSGFQGAGFTIPSEGNAIYNYLQYTGEGINRVDFTNDKGDTPPTGISIDNLPYIVLIAVGLIALAGAAAFYVRRKKKQDA